MATDRRAVLALSGALLAGMAGCISDDSDDSDPNGGGPNGDGNGDENGDENGGNDGGFEDYDVPAFPELSLVTEPAVAESALAEQVRSNVDFSLDLAQTLRTEHPDENLFFSPYSVSVALAMTYAGARVETAQEMREALRFRHDHEELHPLFGALEAEFEQRNEDGEAFETVEDEEDAESDGPGFQLELANSQWAQTDFPFEDEFLDLLSIYYGAGLQLVDFQGSPEDARQQINAWVESRTNDRIEELLPAESIDEMTRMVLVNAIYFKATWKHEFDEDETEPGTFTGLDGDETEVAMMSQTLEVPYAEIEGHQLVELPYANEETSMVIILPAEGEFADFESSLTVDRLATMLDQAQPVNVDLELPRFGIDTEFSLVEALESLGMERAFDERADFDGISDDADLYVSDVRHKAMIDVDEEGTEAAAATAVVITLVSANPRSAEMTVDRPFLCYIRDRPTETPLFFGRVVDGATLQAE